MAPTQKEMDLRMSIANPAKRNYTFTDRLLGKPFKNIGGVSLVSPLALAGRGAIFKVVGGAYRGAVAAFRAMGKMTLGQKLGAGGMAVGAYAGGTLLAGGTPAATPKQALGLGLSALNPLVATFSYGGEKVSQGINKIKNTGIPWVNYTPNVSIPQQFERFKDYMTPGSAQTFNIESGTPATAPNINLPSFNFSAGGGGMDPMLMALLIAALAGGTGYVLGKKKKKKYKKKRKYKNA